MRATVLSVVCSTVLVAATAGCGQASETHFVETWNLHAPGGEPRVVELPERFRDDLPEEPSHYELRATVRIPDNWRRSGLSLSIPHQSGRIEMLADGVAHRQLDIDDTDHLRSVGQHIWPLDAEVTRDGVVEFVLRVDHRWAQSGWFDTVPRLSNSPLGDVTTRAVRSINRWGAYVAIGMLLSVFFTYLVLGVVARSRTYGLYAFQALVALFYPLFVLGVTRIAGPFETPMLGTTLGLAVVSLLYSSNAAFGLKSNRYLWPGLTAAFIVAALVTSNPFLSTYLFGPTVIVYLFAILGYETVRLTRLLRRPTRPTTLVPNMLAMVFVTVLSTPDIPMWIRLGEPFAGLRMVPLGLGVYTLLHLIAICAETLKTMRDAEEHQREIQVLNTELRRQVAERSKQLGEALGRLASESGLAKDLEPDQIVNERYRVVERLGDGAMGVVYRCERLSDGRALALKVLKTTSDASAMARFAREAQLASEIRSDQVVGILDVDFALSGFMFVIMELVEGATVRDCKSRYGDVPWACHVLGQVARGLAVIHEHGVVHRDLKPANVLLQNDGDGRPPSVKITDFGISGMAADLEQSASGPTAPLSPLAMLQAQSDIATMSIAAERTAPSQVTTPMPGRTEKAMFVGTPAYMAPELAMPTVGASPTTDAYSFGIMAYELLVGRRPFDEPPVITVAGGSSLGAPPSVRASSPDVPAAIADIVARCLDTTPAARPTADEIAAVFGVARARPSAASIAL